MTPPLKQDEASHFPERLKQAIGDMSARSFAAKNNLSSTAIHKYLTGKSEPTRLALISIANIANVNLEWLVTGEGLMRKTKGSELVDLELYDGIIEAVEEYLLKSGTTSCPKDKIRAYHYLYDEFKSNLEIDKEKVSKTLRLVFS